MVAPGGLHGCSGGGHAWLLQGACVVAPEGHAWLLGGVCMVALGGSMCGCSGGGVCGCSGGGHVWLLPGGACMVARGIRRETEIRSMSGRYASYWNAFLLCSEIINMLNSNISCLLLAKK